MQPTRRINTRFGCTAIFCVAHQTIRAAASIPVVGNSQVFAVMTVDITAGVTCSAIGSHRSGVGNTDHIQEVADITKVIAPGVIRITPRIRMTIRTESHLLIHRIVAIKELAE